MDDPKTWNRRCIVRTIDLDDLEDCVNKALDAGYRLLSMLTNMRSNPHKIELIFDGGLYATV